MRNYYLGDFGAPDTDINSTYVVAPEAKSPGSQDASSIINTLSNITNSSVNRSLDTAGKILSAEEVQDILKANGLDVIFKDMKKEVVINLLAFFGFYHLGKLVKNKYVLGGLGLGIAGLIINAKLQGTQKVKSTDVKIG